MAVVGFAIAIFSGKNSKQIKKVSAIILLIVIGTSYIPFYAFANDNIQNDIEGVDVQISDYVYAHNAFKITINIDNLTPYKLLVTLKKNKSF